MNTHETTGQLRRWPTCSLASWACLLVLGTTTVPACGDPLATDSNGDTVTRGPESSEHREALLLRAAKRGDRDEIQALLRDGVAPDAPDEDGDTPLHWAFMGSHASSGAEIARTLVEAGASPDPRGSLQATPLHYAAKRGDLDAVRVLLDAGANPGADDEDGDTPLHWTFLADHAFGAMIVRALVEAGAAPDARGSFQATPLHLAAKLGDHEAVTTLIEAGSDPDAPDEDGDTPLYWAGLDGQVRAARALLAAGNEARRTTTGPATAIDVAIRNGGLRVLDVLLEAGLDRSLPSFSFPDASGQAFTNRDIEGKVTLLNLWATWCGPCRSEMPWFVEFQDRYRDRGFTVAAISMDEDGWDAVHPFARELGLNFPVLMGGDDAEACFGAVDAIPATLIVDRSGKIAFWHEGVPDKSEYERQIESLL
ncbi:MAG: ankyrin repeat domain-containing protein [Bryobacterales bacterium]|nr:ankyrin repeat domain-containing protein [Bryobacterales bacterium]